MPFFSYIQVNYKSMDYKGITTFKQIATKYLQRTQRPMSDYKRVVGLAIDGYREVQLFHLGTVRKKTQYMSDINTIDIPDDYMAFISVSVKYKGREWILTKDGSLISPNEEVNGVPVNADTIEHEFYRTYGTGGGQNDYYYKVEEHNRRIIINGFPRTNVTLTYKSTGISMTEDTSIPLTAEPAILAFIRWQLAESEAEMQGSVRYNALSVNAERHKQNYIEETRILDSLRGSTIDEIYDAIYSTWKQSPKR